jgi:hypothetical protein
MHRNGSRPRCRQSLPLALFQSGERGHGRLLASGAAKRLIARPMPSLQPAKEKSAFKKTWSRLRADHAVVLDVSVRGDDGASQTQGGLR